MNIQEREEELNELFNAGEITQKEWALLWAQALEDYECYPEDEVLS